MIRRPPRSTHCISSAASDVYKRQEYVCHILQLYKIQTCRNIDIYMFASHIFFVPYTQKNFFKNKEFYVQIKQRIGFFISSSFFYIFLFIVYIYIYLYIYNLYKYKTKNSDNIIFFFIIQFLFSFSKKKQKNITQQTLNSFIPTFQLHLEQQ
eukprot:TRINITY_DN2965_c0_g1_i2.p2 TRINITY_DN2965_c0_g1~~TRINITY_DN2965_c0_g1_i2.p2  ORF type:complete len:152 (-),score=35.30 TRINITY_DN2965_c0_g1_i2:65-520(-)